MAELDPEINTLRSNVTKVLRKHYKWLLGIVGLPGIGDLVREYARSKAMEYVVSKLGWFGDFLVANPVALTSMGVGIALIVLTIMVVSESSRETPSLIYEHRDKRFMRPPAPRRWVAGFVITMLAVVAVIAYGTYRYWLHTSSRLSANTPTTPDAHAQATIPKDTPKSPVQPGHSKTKQHVKPLDGHSETPQPLPNVNTPQESPAVTVKPVEITPDKHEIQPTGAPSNIIPQDPVKAVEVVDHMRRSLADVIRKKDTVTFLMSWPDDDNSNLVLVSGLISDACRETPRQCWFAQKNGDARDLDKPPIPDSGRNGFTIHGADARSLATALGAWFSTYSTETYPSQLNGYKYKETKELVWIEIGPGSPWKAANH